MNRRDPTCPSTISVHQIRDALFLKSSTRERNTLWPLVVEAIASNSSVRESVMSVQGEQQRMWEWIGADILTDIASGRRDSSVILREGFPRVATKPFTVSSGLYPKF